MHQLRHWFLILTVCCLPLTACGMNGNTQDGAAPNDTGLGNTDTRYRMTDGDNNYTRQNPNIRANDPTPITNQSEARRMEQAAEQVSGVTHATVRIVGGRALIRLTVDRGLDRDDATAVVNEVQRQLSIFMPRFDIHVSANIDRLGLAEAGELMREDRGNWRPMQTRFRNALDQLTGR